MRVAPVVGGAQLRATRARCGTEERGAEAVGTAPGATASEQAGNLPRTRPTHANGEKVAAHCLSQDAGTCSSARVSGGDDYAADVDGGSGAIVRSDLRKGCDSPGDFGVGRARRERVRNASVGGRVTHDWDFVARLSAAARS